MRPSALKATGESSAARCQPGRHGQTSSKHERSEGTQVPARASKQFERSERTQVPAGIYARLRGTGARTLGQWLLFCMEAECDRVGTALYCLLAAPPRSAPTLSISNSSVSIRPRRCGAVTYSLYKCPKQIGFNVGVWLIQLAHFSKYPRRSIDVIRSILRYNRIK